LWLLRPHCHPRQTPPPRPRALFPTLVCSLQAGLVAPVQPSLLKSLALSRSSFFPARRASLKIRSFMTRCFPQSFFLICSPSLLSAPQNPPFLHEGDRILAGTTGIPFRVSTQQVPRFFTPLFLNSSLPGQFVFLYPLLRPPHKSFLWISYSPRGAVPPPLFFPPSFLLIFPQRRRFGRLFRLNLPLIRSSLVLFLIVSPRFPGGFFSPSFRNC